MEDTRGEERYEGYALPADLEDHRQSRRERYSASMGEAPAVEARLRETDDVMGSALRRGIGQEMPEDVPRVQVGTGLLDRNLAVQRALWDEAPPETDAEHRERIRDGRTAVRTERQIADTPSRFISRWDRSESDRDTRRERSSGELAAMRRSMAALPESEQAEQRYHVGRAEVDSVRLDGLAHAAQGVATLEALRARIEAPEGGTPRIAAPEHESMDTLVAEQGVTAAGLVDGLAATPEEGHADHLVDPTLPSRARQLAEWGMARLPESSPSRRALARASERWEADYERLQQIVEERMQLLELSRDAFPVDMDAALDERRGILEGVLGTIVGLFMPMSMIDEAENEQMRRASGDVQDEAGQRRGDLEALLGVLQDREQGEAYLMAQRIRSQDEGRDGLYEDSRGETHQAMNPSWLLVDRWAQRTGNTGYQREDGAYETDRFTDEHQDETEPLWRAGRAVRQDEMVSAVVRDGRGMGVTRHELDNGIPRHAVQSWDFGSNERGLSGPPERQRVAGRYSDPIMTDAQQLHLDQQRHFIEDERDTGLTIGVLALETIVYAITGAWVLRAVGALANVSRAAVGASRLGQMALRAEQTVAAGQALSRTERVAHTGLQAVRQTARARAFIQQRPALRFLVSAGETYAVAQGSAAVVRALEQRLGRSHPLVRLARVLSNLAVAPSEIRAAGGAMRAAGPATGSNALVQLARRHGVPIGIGAWQILQDQALLPALIEDPELRQEISMLLGALVSAGVGAARDRMGTGSRAGEMASRLNVDGNDGAVRAIARELDGAGSDLTAHTAESIAAHAESLHATLVEHGVSPEVARRTAVDRISEWAATRSTAQLGGIRSDGLAREAVTRLVDGELAGLDGRLEALGGLTRSERGRIQRQAVMTAALAHVDPLPEGQARDTAWFVRRRDQVQAAFIDRGGRTPEQARLMATMHIHGEIQTLRAGTEGDAAATQQLDGAEAALQRGEIALAYARSLAPELHMGSEGLRSLEQAVMGVLDPALAPAEIAAHGEMAAQTLERVATDPNPEAVAALRRTIDERLGAAALTGTPEWGIDVSNPPDAAAVQARLDTVRRQLRAAGVPDARVDRIASGRVLGELLAPVGSEAPSAAYVEHLATLTPLLEAATGQAPDPAHSGLEGLQRELSLNDQEMRVLQEGRPFEPATLREVLQSGVPREDSLLIASLWGQEGLSVASALGQRRVAPDVVSDGVQRLANHAGGLATADRLLRSGMEPTTVIETVEGMDANLTDPAQRQARRDLMARRISPNMVEGTAARIDGDPAPNLHERAQAADYLHRAGEDGRRGRFTFDPDSNLPGVEGTFTADGGDAESGTPVSFKVWTTPRFENMVTQLQRNAAEIVRRGEAGRAELFAYVRFATQDFGEQLPLRTVWGEAAHAGGRPPEEVFSRITFVCEDGTVEYSQTTGQWRTRRNDDAPARTPTDAATPETAPSLSTPVTGPTAGRSRTVASRLRGLGIGARELWSRVTGGPPPAPDNAVFLAPNLAEARRMYLDLIARDPAREAGMHRHPGTGEVVVVQGTGDWVNGGVANPWVNPHNGAREAATGPVPAGERFVILEHYHPERNQLVQFPSWADYQALIWQHGGANAIQSPVRSRIRYRDALTGRDHFTIFGFDPAYVGHPLGPYFGTITLANGVDVDVRFRSEAALQGAYQRALQGHELL